MSLNPVNPRVVLFNPAALAGINPDQDSRWLAVAPSAEAVTPKISSPTLSIRGVSFTVSGSGLHIDWDNFSNLLGLLANETQILRSYANLAPHAIAHHVAALSSQQRVQHSNVLANVVQKLSAQQNKPSHTPLQKAQIQQVISLAQSVLQHLNAPSLWGRGLQLADEQKQDGSNRKKEEEANQKSLEAEQHDRKKELQYWANHFESNIE